MSHNIVFVIVTALAIFVTILLCGLLKHQSLHHIDFLLKLTLLLGHEVFDHLQHFLVPLRKLQNVLDVELVYNLASFLLLSLIPFGVLHGLAVRLILLLVHDLLAFIFVKKGHAVET